MNSGNPTQGIKLKKLNLGNRTLGVKLRLLNPLSCSPAPPIDTVPGCGTRDQRGQESFGFPQWVRKVRLHRGLETLLQLRTLGFRSTVMGALSPEMQPGSGARNTNSFLYRGGHVEGRKGARGKGWNLPREGMLVAV